MIDNKLVIGEKQNLQKLLPLLEKQIARYTCGESSSVRSEVAEALLQSVVYTLNNHIPEENLEEEFKKGQKTLERKIHYAKTLLQKVIMNLPPVQNVSMMDTLKSIGESFKKYDYRLFAQDFPADIDYQLSVPIDESIMGIDYVVSYLSQLSIENQFICNYKKEDLEPVLNNYCPDYEGLLINLFDPIFTRTLSMTLIEKQGLQISKDDIEKIRLMLNNMSRTEVENCLIKASKMLLEPKPFILKYCRDLSVRICKLRDNGGLEGML